MSDEPATCTVVIPTCDRPTAVCKAVDAALSQTRPPQQVLVIDNGRRGCRDLLIGTPGVEYHRIISRAGVSQARNFGISIATGGWIAFLDDDDLWPPDYLEEMFKAIDEGPVDGLIARKDRYSDGTVIPYKDPTEHAMTVESLLAGVGMGGSNVIVKRAVLCQIGGYDVRFASGEDVVLGIDLMRAGYVIRATKRTGAWTRVQGPPGDRLTAVSVNKALSRHVRLIKYYEIMSPRQRAEAVARILPNLIKHAPGWLLKAQLRIALKIAAVYGRRRK